MRVNVIRITEGIHVEKGEEDHLETDERILNGERQHLGRQSGGANQASGHSDRDGKPLPKTEKDDAFDAEKLGKRAITWL